MNRFTDIRRYSRIAAAGFGALVAVTAWTLFPGPAEARVFVGIGIPFPGYYGYPCCGYAAPYPYPYPPAYYPPPPPPAYYPPPAAYPAPAAAPPQQPATPTATASITYTGKPAFTNAAGQTCREFKTPQNTFGTACRDSNGQWRVQN